MMHFLWVVMAIAAPPKAIILMLGDDYGYTNVGFAHGPPRPDGGVGNPEMKTPNMDALAADGIILERHYTYKYCSPTRSSLMSGRLPTHVNQNNKNNDIEATSGCDLRFKFLAQKMKEAGYHTAMVGKSHLGARSTANLPINRGFDVHFGFLKGGEDHYTQGSGSTHGEGKTVDLWDGHGLSNMTGMYSGYIYTQRAVEVITNFSATNQANDRAGERTDAGLFMYLAWHNTHSPLECPAEWMYPNYYNDSSSSRQTYNCMARILDDGIGNVTTALKAAGLWEESLVMFAGDNGGWVGAFGSNNYPLKGSKVSDFEGGVRVVSFLSGGYLPAAVKGTQHSGMISIADWYGTLCTLVGVSPVDDVEGLPPVESNNFWPSILTPNANSTGRTDVFLSWSCTASSANVTGCDPNAPSIYGTSGDPTGGQSKGDMALISGQYKIVIGRQEGRGIFFGPIYPNTTSHRDQPAYPCVEGCIYNIFEDPTEHVNLKDSLPDVWTQMLSKLNAHGKTVYQTDYAEPNTTECFTGAQAAAYYVGHNTCLPNSPSYNPSGSNCDASQPRLYLGPMCFNKLPPIPNVPPAPPPAPPAPAPPATVLSIVSDGQVPSVSCMVTTGTEFAPMTLGSCDAAKQWVSVPEMNSWTAWSHAGVAKMYMKVSEKDESGGAAEACKRGQSYVNANESKSGGPTSQGFAIKALGAGANDGVQLVSSLCSGMCLGYPHGTGAPPQRGAMPKVMECSSVLPFYESVPAPPSPPTLD